MSSYPPHSAYNSPPVQPQRQSLPLPLSKPFFTYALLAAIGVVFLIEELVGGSTSTEVLIMLGANSGRHILLNGEVWRLFASMFLHIGLMHLFFNGYALFIFGLEMERIYGPDRYIVVYVLAGLFGSLASFAARGPLTLSAGASGAIFGVIGMNLAFFLLHRDSFGQFGRQRMISTLVIIGVNLAFGFTVKGIDNYAHMGGLVAGFALGYGLAPRYTVNNSSIPPRVVDTVSLLSRWWVPAFGVVLLTSGVYLSMIFWLAKLGI